jgi:hypothetical protein
MMELDSVSPYLQELSRPLNTLEMRSVVEYLDPLDWFSLACVDRRFSEVVRRDFFFSGGDENERADLRYAWFRPLPTWWAKLITDDDENAVTKHSIYELINCGFYHSLRRFRWRSGGGWDSWHRRACSAGPGWHGTQLELACRTGDVRLLRLLDEEKFFDWDLKRNIDVQTAFVATIECRKLAVLEWLVRRYDLTWRDNNTDSTSSAAFAIPVVDRFAIKKFQIFAEGFRCAASHGWIEGFDWLLVRSAGSFVFESNVNPIWVKAALGGHVALLEKLTEIREASSVLSANEVALVTVFHGALEADRVEAAAWLFETFQLASYGQVYATLGHIVIHLAHRNIAACNALRWLLEQFEDEFVWSIDPSLSEMHQVLRVFMENGRLLAVQWFLSKLQQHRHQQYQNDVTSSSFSLPVGWLFRAAKSGNLELVEWLVHTFRWTRDDLLQTRQAKCVLAEIPASLSSSSSSVKLAQYLTRRFAITRDEVRANDNEVFCCAALNNDVRLAAWIASHFKLTARDVRAQREVAIHSAQLNDRQEMLAFFRNVFGILTTDD